MPYEDLYSSALVDYSGFSKTLNDLNSSFSLLEFLDLCAILEGLILHDKLVVIRGKNIAEHHQVLLKPLFDEGILVHEPEYSPVIDPGQKPGDRAGEREFNVSSLRLRQRSYAIQKSTLLDSWYETGRLLGAEKTYGCSPLSLIRQRPFYEKYGQTKERHTISNLFGQYQDLSKTLTAIRKQTRIELTPYLVVPIPPIPLLVLRLCNNYSDVISRTLDLREDYRRLRESLRQLRQDLADETVPPYKKMQAIRSWEKTWSTLSQYEREFSTIEFANNALDIPNLNMALEGLDIDAVRLDKLLQKAILTANNAFHRWRINLLHKAAKKYLATPDSDLNGEVHRLFGYQVSQADFDILDQFLRRTDETNSRRNVPG